MWQTLVSWVRSNSQSSKSRSDLGVDVGSFRSHSWLVGEGERKMAIRVGLTFVLACCGSSVFAQKADELPTEIFLYEGDAPGSEGLSHQLERVRSGENRVVTNVHRPSIFPYLPRKDRATGMALIIAPGGGHNSLWSTHEGHNPAKYFANHGIASFVLCKVLCRVVSLMCRPK